LNIALTYLAAHISLPGLWPLLVFAEIQVGRWLRGGGRLSIHPSELRHQDPWQFGIDLLVGSAVVGITLAIPLALLTYRTAVKRRKAPAIHDLIEETAHRYLGSGMFHWEFVRGKLRHDPVYLEVLQQGLLPMEGRLLDLGCGRGILLSLLLTARDRFQRGLYPEGWPPPPALDLHGIETGFKAATAARAALGDQATIDIADLRDSGLPPSRAVLLLDVLHYLPAEAQEDLLRRIAGALEPGGLLLIRDADADAGLRFLATRLQERICAMARRHWKQRFHYRSAAEWSRLLESAGFTVDLQPMGMGTPYGNVLLTARRGSGPVRP
jgi:SAM-dependent methyltransferase